MSGLVSKYEPLPTCLELRRSDLHGYGLFTKAELTAGSELGITHIADKSFQNGYIRTALGSFINHSFEPNAVCEEIDDLLFLVTTKDIKKGVEITVDYTGWYDLQTLATFN